jgi:hypothetical protein
MSARTFGPLLVAALVAAIGVGLGAPVRSDDLPALPGPAPRARGAEHDPAKENARCEGCHTDEAGEWRGSLHQEAWTDPVFQKAYAIEPVAFCRGCHAPESDPNAAPTEAAQGVGVGCTTCHVQGDSIVGPRTLAASAESHAVRGDERLATREACASCHQFDFPRSKGQPMQDTLAEHAGSSMSAVECRDCHMPLVERADGTRRRSHDFSVISNPRLLEQAVAVEAERDGASDLSIELSAGRVGHAFPTGDMFRRLEIRAEALDAEGKVVMTAPVVHLARKFRDVPAAEGSLEIRRVEIADTRVPPPGKGSRRVSLCFPSSTERLSVRWIVAYQRMDHAMAASFDVEQARDEIVVARGLVPPLISKPQPKEKP